MESILKYKEGRRVSIITLLINSFLSISKISIGYFTHCQAILADGIHSASDSFSTIIVLFSLKIASNPPDKCHPYGHGRSDTLAANILALSLILSGLIIIKNNIICIIKQDYHLPQVINIWAALISIFAQEGAYRYSVHIGKKIKSTALIADAMHHRSDAFSSAAALIGVIAARYGFIFLDPLAGIIVAIMIVKIGIELLVPIINEIMEKSPNTKYINYLEDITRMDSSIRKVDNIKIREHAGRRFIEMTICVDPHLYVDEAHEIAEKAKNRLINENKDKLINDVIVHIHPAE